MENTGLLVILNRFDKDLARDTIAKLLEKSCVKKARGIIGV